MSILLTVQKLIVYGKSVSSIYENVDSAYPDVITDRNTVENSKVLLLLSRLLISMSVWRKALGIVLAQVEDSLQILKDKEGVLPKPGSRYAFLLLIRIDV